MSKRYAAVNLGKREYTFHFVDGDLDLDVGDKVEVATKHGTTKGRVSSFVDETPNFPTQPIISIVEKAGPEHGAAV